MTPGEQHVEPAGDLLAAAWAAVLAPDVDGPAGPEVEVRGGPADLASTFRVEDLAVASVAAALRAAAVLQGRRTGQPARRSSVDRGHVAAAVRSERAFRREGDDPAGPGFAPLSRFWRAADGWVRTHANHPWHRAALLEALGTPEDADAERVAGAVAARSASEVEEAVVAAGGVAGRVRSLVEWADHPQGRAVAAEPLIGNERVGDAAPRRHLEGDLPASGAKVLDLTRVIAGPVCTRYLAALGADVLRLDPPHRPDLRPGHPADTLLGKRSAVLDLRTASGRRELDALLADADVVVSGYRPGALDRFGLDPAVLARDHPGIVAVHLAAWGHTGPWAGRRGFDSVVQAPSGIALGESVDGEEPGALPCQLLDHATGYLAAAAALDGLRRQTDEGGSHVRRVSLARTAWWLTGAGRDDPDATGPGGSTAEPWLTTLDGADGRFEAVLPPGILGDRPLAWPGPTSTYGADLPRWRIGAAGPGG